MLRASRRVLFSLTNTLSLYRSCPHQRRLTSAIMGDNNRQPAGTGVGADKKPNKSSSIAKKDVKILMLHGELAIVISIPTTDYDLFSALHTYASRTLTSHILSCRPREYACRHKSILTICPGYTQSGPLFRSKTRALEKILAKALAPLNLAPVLIYPTAPNRLRPKDIPGYDAPSDDDNDEHGTETDSWAWYRKDEASGAYRFLKEGMLRVAESMGTAIAGAPADEEAPTLASESSAPIAGVIGFSQGGSMAAMLAAAMENPHQARTVPSGEDWAWVRAVREANRGIPLRFAVIYSGFYAPPEELAWLYEPPVVTSTLHFIGSLDTVIDESRSRGLVTRCQDPVVIVHPGGHHVPVSKEWVMPLVGFIRKCVE